MDSARAMVFGLALGDALGWPVEFLQLTQIRARYGREGITAPPDPALYTDDMTNDKRQPARTRALRLAP
jgi:ADP-ribosylglycohydrolase